MSLHTFIFLLLPSITFSSYSDACSQPPDNGFITAQQMDFVCEHREHWIKQQMTTKSTWNSASNKQLQYLSEVERCTRNNCVKQSRRRKRQSSKSTRREIRMMSQQQREALFEAMNSLKTTFIDNITAWDLHTLVHYPDSAPGAHWGAAFLPWHREFLRQFEIALQRENPTVTLPFWDSTLDEGLPDPADSVLFTDELLGNGNGYVKTGPFKDWDTNVLMPLSQIPVKKLYRSTGGRPQDRLLSPKDVDWITSRKHYKDLTFCHDKTFESMHGLSHVWVGGFMFVIRVSPNDPMFYMHHAFVDNIWEQFRQRSQDRLQRENQWAQDTCNKLHGFDEQMKPFRIQNRDGLSNRYTDEWYEYEPVRHCTPSRSDCDSPYYWCDITKWRCRSKVVLGGNCTGYEGQPICYNSVCVQGSCVVPPRVVPSMRQTFSAIVPSEVVWTKTLLIDQYGQGINSPMTTVTVHDLQKNSTVAVHGMSETKYPEVEGLVYLPIPKPRAGMIQHVTLEARDAHGRYCQAHCYNSTVERFQVCQPNLTVGFRAESSSPISYTHSMSSRKFLDVDLSLHPREIIVSAPFIVFACSRKLMTSSMITSLTEKTKSSMNYEDSVWFRVAVHRQSDQNLQVEVSSDEGTLWTSSVRRASSPFDPNLIHVQAPNPILHRAGVRVQVKITENGRKRSCIMKCTKKDGSMHECDGMVELHNQPELSEEDVFTSDESELQLLGWNMRGHPTQWRHKVPYLAFYC